VVSIQFNRIGYEAKKAAVNVTPGQTSTQDATLSQAAFSLSEVVVTVTGAQKKAEIANTVASVDIAAKAQETTANSLGQLLSGQAAGVQIISAGAAGGGSRIRIRGTSSLSLGNAPVVYVDGIKINSDATDWQRDALVPLRRHQPRRNRVDRHSQGPRRRDALRNGSGEWRHQHHDEKGQKRLDAVVLLR
jgi:outer membrane receptor protein involved in Fe transport